MPRTIPPAGLSLAVLVALTELPVAAHEGEQHAALWWGFVVLGRFHVLVVHFPIALIVLIGLIEVWRWWRRDQTPNALLLPLTLLTALSAVVAASMGWFQAASMTTSGREAELLQVHRWTGTATALVAVLMAITRWRLERVDQARLMIVHRSVLAVGVLLVSVSGHVGGLLVHGEDYLSSAFPWAQTAMPAAPPMPPMPTHSGSAPAPTPHEAMPADDHQGHAGTPTAAPAATSAAPPGSPPSSVFVRDIIPVLSASCVECHGATKQKGDLRVDSRQALLSGGATGPAIVPGRGDASLLIQRLRGQGGDPRMPKKKDPIPEATIAAISRWIDQGAVWPAGITVPAP